MPIYLDNAATSFPKPEPVYVAMDRASREYAVSAGRGKYQRANDSDRILQQARNAIAHEINAASANEVSFAFSGTDALSTAILGYVRSGDHVIASAADHTSVLRPLWHLERHRDVELTIVDCDEQGVVDAGEVESACKENTRLICLTHASNVTGALQPVETVGKICRGTDAAFLIDAAQTVGHLPINVEQLHCNFLAAPAHKGLLGPLGTGFLYVASTVADACYPFRFGGTGSTGSEVEQPKTTPQKFESGNLNVPGIAGVLAGIKWIQTNRKTENDVSPQVTSRLLAERLMQIDNVVVYGTDTIQTPTISFNIEGIDCQTVGMLLDSQFQIECRTGLHCAPLIHEKIGSSSFGGTVRFSPGVFTTENEIDQAIAAVESIADQMGASK